MESSPDPLAMSPLPARSGRATKKESKVKKGPLAHRSSNVSLRENTRSVSPTIKTPTKSPMKSMILSTGGTPGQTTPWRIKVTVQAEPDSDQDNTPTRGYKTTTTTVPLKGFEDSSPVVKRRGRPRKSDTGITKATKRSGTPARKSSNVRRKLSMGLEDDSIADSGLDTAEPPKRKRGRPRKSLQKSIDPAVSEVNTFAQLDGTSSIMDDGKFSEQSVNPHFDELATQNKPASRPRFDIANATPLFKKYTIDPPRVETPDPNIKTVKGRKGTPRKPTGWSEKDLSPLPESSPIKATEPTPTVDTSNPRFMRDKLFSDEGPTQPIPGPVGDARLGKTPSPNSNQLDNQVDDNLLDDMEDDEYDDVLGELENRTGVTIIGERTMMESEEFSMVSIDSLPSRQVGNSMLMDTTHYSTGETSRKSLPSVSVERRSQLQNDLSNLLMVDAKSSPIPGGVPQHTPQKVASSPVNPPPIALSQPPTSKVATTPEIAKVVRAGIALQGALDTDTRSSPRQSAKSRNLQAHDVDDPLGAFGEGTQRDLRAGLRLGEQLSHTAQAPKSSPYILTRGSVSKSKDTEVIPDDDVFSAPSSVPSKSLGVPRLLTPEDKDDYTLAVPPPPCTRDEIHYPSLSARVEQGQLISPTRSEDEMSWHADTPPSTEDESFELGNPLANVERSNAQVSQASAVKSSMQQSVWHDREAQWQREREEVIRQAQEANSSRLIVIGDSSAVQPDSDDDEEEERKGAEQDNEDVWIEEASRLSDSLSQAKVPQDHLPKEPEPTPDLSQLFAGDNKPRRSKIPRTWRRRSSGNFNYSDSPQHQDMPSPDPNDRTDTRLTSSPPEINGPRRVNNSRLQLVEEDEDIEDPRDDLSERSPTSEDSDDTGLFWQTNLPNVYNRKKEKEKFSEQKLDMSVLMGLDSSPLKSSPLNRRSGPTSYEKTLLSNVSTRSPVKSSPLKRQLFSADISSQVEESEDELSPRRAAQEEERARIVFLQRRAEMEQREGFPYPKSKPTEPPRQASPDPKSKPKSKVVVVSPLPKVSRNLFEPGKTYPPLFPNTKARKIEVEDTKAYNGDELQNHEFEEDQEDELFESEEIEVDEVDESQETELDEPDETQVSEMVSIQDEDFGQTYDDESEERSPSLPRAPLRHSAPTTHNPTQAPPTPYNPSAQAPSPAPAPAPGLISRLKSTIWSTFISAPVPEPPLHPVISTLNLQPLPRLEPWTKSHYIILDALFQAYKRDPLSFSPLAGPNKDLNNALLDYKPAFYLRRLAGTRMRNWGYEEEMRIQHMVIVAVFFQLLKLERHESYVGPKGEGIEYGNVDPGSKGTVIRCLAVVRRLWTVVAGERVREDERCGRRIKREGVLEVWWPGWKGWVAYSSCCV
ncbi:hypothetical protein M501DRAFT_1056455 [Patellaria atrata CBS 101060]|uniref:Uncharacterized protein n=1 Tax=Patellaria atrata CBS 101060 TaxID=1346257 RepID=A0A9P4SCE5_9PEZI|nr:hypothetical protein M501DRAFT_1056455 [Patellaria atrata CBS 101060]